MDIQLKLNWKELSKLAELDTIIAESVHKPIMIFKHSTRCSVSRMSLKQFESEFNQGDLVDIWFLDLLNHRDISNKIAEVFAVRHESPQVLLIKNGICTYHASHHHIEAASLPL
jgi:bacillithiol system protein YtxJ